jgi:hypothetical protein
MASNLASSIRDRHREKSTSAPSPNRAPSEKRVLALWKTAALQRTDSPKATKLVSLLSISHDVHLHFDLCIFHWTGPDCEVAHLSTSRRNLSATSVSSVTMQSVCALPNTPTQCCVSIRTKELRKFRKGPSQLFFSTKTRRVPPSWKDLLN